MNNSSVANSTAVCKADTAYLGSKIGPHPRLGVLFTHLTVSEHALIMYNSLDSKASAIFWHLDHDPSHGMVLTTESSLGHEVSMFTAADTIRNHPHYLQPVKTCDRDGVDTDNNTLCLPLHHCDQPWPVCFLSLE